MQILHRRTISLCCLALMLTSMRAKSDPLSELAKFSVFQGVDLSSLAGGKIVTARGPMLDSPRDLSVQAIYVLPFSVQKTLELHKQWDATKHPELKVYAHRDLSAKPALGDFVKSTSIPSNAAVRSLISATQKLPAREELQMSNAEAKEFANASGGTQGAMPQAVSEFWSQLLFKRASSFVEHGLGAQPAYDFAKQSARVSEEASRLLKEQPKLRSQFQALISQTPLGGDNGSLSPSLYWELFDVEGQAAFSLGAAYSRDAGDSSQLLDMQYYASGGYFVFITLYQMWPITVDNHPATLVWRGDSISSLALSELHGVERMGSGAAMMKEIQRTINFFQKDTGR
jgi:hypothetical protein